MNETFGDTPEPNPLELREQVLSQCPASLTHALDARVEQSGDRLAFLVPSRKATKDAETWREVDYRTFRDEVHELAAGLLTLGVQPEDRVAIAAVTRYEWVLADMAIACSGAALTAIYPNCTDHDELYILKDSGTTMMFAENQQQVSKVQAHDDELYDQLRHIIIIDDDREAVDRVDQRVITLDELRARGREALAGDAELVRRSIERIGPESLATLIYTSGTTGRPKGVELTHLSMVYVGQAFKRMGFLSEEDRHYLWLPLSHVFGNCLLSAQWAYGFATAIDGRPDRIVQGLAETHPTVMCGVPRIYEKIRAAVLTASPKGGAKGRIARWAFAVGRESRAYRYEGQPMPVGLKMRYGVADKLVFDKLKKTMGGEMRFLISGSAKLSSQVTEWFYSAGIHIIEGYGSTETTVSILNPPEAAKFGSIGPVVPGMEVSFADDGEMLLRGPLVFRGYHNRPEKTAEVLDADGWFHTGDVAELDEDGYIFITDRKRDLIKSSGGKYVAPQKVENAITANIPYVSQAVALGENRKYMVALVTMEREALLRWGRNHGHAHASYEELTQLPEVKASIERFMAKANAKLERWETIKRFAILDHEFKVDDGGVTPTQKVRRDVIARKYAHIVDSLYDKED
ncbi:MULTISPECIES: AMP-dependent synthetase/ligase [unclassified Luteococcus]|uniref:AMP-dependent synthetase/ligase n=1 Tax=unclassified Luteococcus TaxID=2639923 RepID=UPI00313B2FC3